MPYDAEGKEENQNWSIHETILIVDHQQIIVYIFKTVCLIHQFETKYHIKNVIITEYLDHSQKY